MSNFYEILGVSNKADISDIKKAYKQLAKQYHPDKNKSPEASEKFKEISVAYDTLKDTEKREEYDLQLRFGGQKGGFRNPGATYSGSSGATFDDLFAEVLRRRDARAKSEKAQNDDINEILRNQRSGWGRNARNVDMDFSSETLFRDPENDIFGNKNQKKAENTYEAIPNITFDLTLDECINGTVRHFVNKETGKEIKINIPARVTPEDILKIKSPRVDINIKPKFRKWKFKDGDVYLNIPIDKFKGHEFIEIETILGEKISLKSPPENEIYVGKKLRLKNKGWLNRKDERTNMYITIS